MELVPVVAHELSRIAELIAVSVISRFFIILVFCLGLLFFLLLDFFAKDLQILPWVLLELLDTWLATDLHLLTFVCKADVVTHFAKLFVTDHTFL